MKDCLYHPELTDFGIFGGVPHVDAGGEIRIRKNDPYLKFSDGQRSDLVRDPTTKMWF
jgi:hypothetical protein